MDAQICPVLPEARINRANGSGYETLSKRAHYHSGFHKTSSLSLVATKKQKRHNFGQSSPSPGQTEQTGVVMRHFRNELIIILVFTKRAHYHYLDIRRISWLGGGGGDVFFGVGTLIFAYRYKRFWRHCRSYREGRFEYDFLRFINSRSNLGTLCAKWTPNPTVE